MRGLGMLVAAVLVLAGLVGVGQAAAAPGVDLLSSVPKTVVLDASTGAVLSVSTRSVAPLISNRNVCFTGDACYYTGRIPYAHQAFFGSPGTFFGSWPYRSGWFSGNYTTSACWTGACSAFAFGPNTTVSFGGALVTGTSFTIH